VQRCLVDLITKPAAASLSQIRRWAGLPNEGPLIDCAWIFDNAPELPAPLIHATEF
ncbi:unnamed protein product, partial [Symbiodinium sp. CCMP2456]